MKILLIFLLLFVPATANLFTKSVRVTEPDKREIDLNAIEPKHDSVLFVLWHFRCLPCIKEMDELKAMQAQKNMDIIAVGINLGFEFDEEIKLMKSHGSPFTFYFDSKKELQDYLITNKLIRNDKYFKSAGTGRYTIAVPQAYLFVNRKFVTNNVTVEHGGITFNKMKP